MQVKCLFVYILLCLLLSNLSHAQGGPPKAVSIPDPNLAAAVRESIGDTITTQTLLNLTSLDADEREIEDITGLEHAHNLRHLYLQKNAISDVSPLSGLTQLTVLLLALNNISDISPLVDLKQLNNLGLLNNQILDVSPLADLKQLTRLSLGGNHILDVSALANLKQLTSLGLSSNYISDVSPLAELKKLTWLELWDNNISDVSPLIGLNPTGAQSGVYISRNPLSYASIHTHIPALQAKGFQVTFDDHFPTTLVKILGNTQRGKINAVLPLPFVVEVRDDRGHPYPDVLVTFTITEGDGRLSATLVKTDAEGRAAARLKMGHTVGKTVVRVTAAHISQSVAFTATAIPRSAPVAIPDANLRAKIAEGLGIPLGETLTVVDMLKLRTLTANSADIHNLTGLEYASHLITLSLENNAISDIGPLVGLTRLTSLSLANNRISDVSPLTGLTRLTTLNLRNNWISDVSPLVGLTRLKSSTNRYGLDLRGNLLGTPSIYKHIPMLEFAGVNVGFESSLTDQKEPMVRLIYFFPRDRQPQPDINAKIDRLIKDVQEFYAEQMAYHGFGRKTFRFETDAHGNAVVYHVKGRFVDQEYNDGKASVGAEIGKQLGSSQINFIVIDVSDYPPFRRHGGITSLFIGTSFMNASTFIPAFVLNTGLAAHELGHAFGLQHDFRSDAYVMSYGPHAKHAGVSYEDILSECAAEWLDVHPHFNPDRSTRNARTNARTTIEMLPPSLVSPPNAIRLRFKVTDPDGIHQVQLHQNRKGSLIACQRLNKNPSHTIVNFLTTALTLEDKSVNVQVIDAHGTVAVFPAFAVDIASLLPPPKAVLIPDPNLAAAVRKNIGNAITTHTLLNLTDLAVSGITDLTGLEHAHHIERLSLGENTISDFSPIAGLTRLDYLGLSNISDLSPLADLKQLTWLDLSGDNISDLSPLAELKQLQLLELSHNNISDISPLADLKKLQLLELSGNSISDLSPLADLKKLNRLDLSLNNISDISPLADLKQLTWFRLSHNNISDVSPLVALDPTKTRSGSLWIYLRFNPLSDASINTHIPAIQANGISVRFDDPTAPPQNALQMVEKITGPWLWMIAPTEYLQGGARSIDVDSLAAASSGIVTEAEVATNGAAEGDEVGNFVWTPGEISSTEGDINECLNRIGMTTGDVNDHSAYALFSLPSDADRTGVTMYVGSDDAIKVWLNGEVVHKNAVNRPAKDFQDTFLVDLKKGDNRLLVKVSERAGAWRMFVGIERFRGTQKPDITADVNDDGVVNVQDLVLVSSRLEEAGEHAADVNGDGVVNIQDLVLVAGELGGAAAAPSALHGTSEMLPARVTVEQWLAAAYRLPRIDVRLQRGIDWLERLLSALPPEETALLANYPNPFNPETWIPYQLAEPAEVTLRIYAVNGALVRTLALGYQPAGVYRIRSRAAYWDGRNSFGEAVASGIYFYTLIAGDFTATRKMLIKK